MCSIGTSRPSIHTVLLITEPPVPKVTEPVILIARGTGSKKPEKAGKSDFPFTRLWAIIWFVEPYRSGKKGFIDMNGRNKPLALPAKWVPSTHNMMISKHWKIRGHGIAQPPYAPVAWPTCPTKLCNEDPHTASSIAPIGLREWKGLNIFLKLNSAKNW